MKIVDDFEEAVRADAFKGAGYPEEVPYIERELTMTRDKLIAALRAKKSKPKE